LSADNHVNTFAHTFFNPRSQGVNIEDWLVGQVLHTHLCNTLSMNGSLYTMLKGSQTFNKKQVGDFFWGINEDDVNGNILTFGPSEPDNNDVKIFSRNLFLNDDYRGTIKAEPSASDFTLAIHLYLGLDEWVPGLHFRIDIPINYTVWSMSLTETVDFIGTSIAANKLGNTTAAAAPNASAIQALNGQLLDTTDFPALQEKMNYARVNGKQKMTHVADITFLLGYDFLCNECGHFGINFQVVAPTGNVPEGRYVFEPIVGNGHHVAVGGGFSGRWELWNNGCDQSFSAWIEGAAYHLFNTKQKRTFDLKANGPLSRYLLLKKFDANGEYANEIVFGPNVLTRELKTNNDVQGEGILIFDYQHGGFTFDVGYTIWGRSKDNITITDPIVGNTYGVQGNTSTQEFDPSTNTTQSLSTVNGTFAPGDANGDGGDLVFITTDDLDINSASHPGAFAHKLLAHFAYTWENCDYLPFLGLGGDIEFSGRGNRAFDRWAVWVKGGFTFA
ncbi:MAG: hypothetical protein WCE21_00620, partial [Candidatus Babeliales bacterium]